MRDIFWSSYLSYFSSISPTYLMPKFTKIELFAELGHISVAVHEVGMCT